MPLELRPVHLSDFDKIASLPEEPLGSLVNPLLPEIWPVDSQAQSLQRSAWSAAQEAWRFEHDSTVHFVKVVDTEYIDESGGKHQDEIVALARWHFYPDGFPPENTWMEVNVFSPPPNVPKFPDGLDGEALLDFISHATADRAKWELTKKGNACWILTTLVTRKGWRRRGAGSMLIDWGVKKAMEMGVVACLEADPDAVGLYKRHGFVEYKNEKVLDLVKMYTPISKA